MSINAQHTNRHVHTWKLLSITTGISTGHRAAVFAQGCLSGVNDGWGGASLPWLSRLFPLVQEFFNHKLTSLTFKQLLPLVAGGCTFLVSPHTHKLAQQNATKGPHCKLLPKYNNESLQTLNMRPYRRHTIVLLNGQHQVWKVDLVINVRETPLQSAILLPEYLSQLNESAILASGDIA